MTLVAIKFIARWLFLTLVKGELDPKFVNICVGTTGSYYKADYCKHE